MTVICAQTLAPPLGRMAEVTVKCVHASMAASSLRPSLSQLEVNYNEAHGTLGDTK